MNTGFTSQPLRIGIACYPTPGGSGVLATELGLAKARGEQVETAVDEAALAPNQGKGTKQALDAANYVSKYSD